MFSEDKMGNKIFGAFNGDPKFILFRGKNNSIHFGENVTLKNYSIVFHCSNSTFSIGNNSILQGIYGIGEGCEITIGHHVCTTGKILLLCAENTSLHIGNECLLANDVTIRTDDSHPIFSVITKERINISQDIMIGNHVWIGEKASILKKSIISDGCVIGSNSVVTSYIPNNCCAAGNPAKVIRYNIAWVNKYLRNPLWDKNCTGEQFFDLFTWRKTEFL